MNLLGPLLFLSFVVASEPLKKSEVKMDGMTGEGPKTAEASTIINKVGFSRLQPDI